MESKGDGQAGKCTHMTWLNPVRISVSDAPPARGMCACALETGAGNPKGRGTTMRQPPPPRLPLLVFG